MESFVYLLFSSYLYIFSIVSELNAILALPRIHCLSYILLLDTLVGLNDHHQHLITMNHVGLRFCVKPGRVIWCYMISAWDMFQVSACSDPQGAWCVYSTSGYLSGDRKKQSSAGAFIFPLWSVQLGPSFLFCVESLRLLTKKWSSPI